MGLKPWLSIFFILIVFEATSQVNYGLVIEPNRLDSGMTFAGKLKVGKEFPSKLLRQRALQQFLLDLYGEGYIAASIDSIFLDSINLKAFYSLGSKYLWATLDGGNVDEEILNSIGYREKLMRGKVLNVLELKKIQEKILYHCENNGYPFAEVFLDSINFHDNPNGDQLVVATLNLTKNTRYIIDSVVVKGDAKIKEGYLYNYLGIKPGDGYNEELTTNIGLRIKEIPFLKETKPAHVIFTDSKANLNLNLSGKQASKFDAMVGFLPSGDSEGKLIITGEARLKLLNSFGVGELIGLNWRSLSPGTQDLETVIAYPFLISRFGIDAGFSLYKKDTIYLDISSNLGIRYLLNRGDYLRVFIKSKETRLLSDQAPLASYANSRSVLYGIGYNKKKLDYLLNPSKGYNLVLAGSAGNKKIKLNSDSNTDSTETKTAEYNINALVDFYFPLGARVVCKIGLNGAFVESESLFENELFRIGGMRTLRGFDEESVTASLYGIYNLELRYLMEQNTFFYVFFNGAYYENEVKRVQNSIWSDHPYGYGAGLTFETKAGIFSINYALGQQMGNPPDFRAAKVHFGIANRF